MIPDDPTPDINPLTQGTGPLLAEMPSVTVSATAGEKTYKFRRVGMRDALRLQQFLIDVLRRGGAEIWMLVRQQFDAADPNMVVAAIAMGLPAAYEAYLAMMGPLISVDPSKLDDPDEFPLDSHVDLIHALLVEHPDVESFLSKSRTKAPGLARAAQTLMPGLSTSSSPATVGPTT